MKRITVSIGIIIAIIIGSVLSLYFMDKNNREMFDRIDRITSMYSQQSEGITKEIEDLQDYWEEYYVRYSYVTQCSTLDDISYSVAKLKSVYEQQSDEFIPECESIKYRVRRIYDRQFPHFYSVF
ncbi:MAG: DUF4363 family protein [Oscillospiraceae bacterium]